MLDLIASEEKKHKDIEEEKKVKMEETITSTGSISLFKKIYERNIGQMVSYNVSWMPLC